MELIFITYIIKKKYIYIYIKLNTKYIINENDLVKSSTENWNKMLRNSVQHYEE